VKRFALVLATLLVASSARAQEQPTPAPASAEEEEGPAPAPARPKDRVLFSLDGGYAYQNLYSTDINGIDLFAVIGADLSTWAVAGIAELDRGWTVYGLTTTTFTSGGLIEGHFGRIRLGAGPRVGTMVIDRVTSHASLGSVSAGLCARASFDLITFHEGHGAFFLVGKASVDTVGTALFGATAGLGVRF
jgi:hypothetical protein